MQALAGRAGVVLRRRCVTTASMWAHVPASAVRLASTSNAKRKERAKALRNLKVSETARTRFKMKPKSSDPLFKDVFRKFMMLVHPDLMAKYPELQETNQQSMKELQEILGQAKSGQHETVLPAVRKTLYFYVRTDTADHFRRVPCELRTTGSNCKHVLGKVMCDLFERCGLPSSFNWGDEYWQRTILTKKTPAGAEDEEEGR